MAVMQSQITLANPPFQGGFFCLDLQEAVQKNMGVSTPHYAGVRDDKTPAQERLTDEH
jgi:hypothetical protein